MKEIVLVLEGSPGESLSGILAGWLAGWLTGRLAGRLAGWLASWLAGVLPNHCNCKLKCAFRIFVFKKVIFYNKSMRGLNLKGQLLWFLSFLSKKR